MAKNNQSMALTLLKKSSCLSGDSQHHRSVRNIASIGSQRAYRDCIKLYLDWSDLNGVPKNTMGSKSILLAYLEEKSEIYQQKTLDQHRMALNAAYHKKLPFIKSMRNTVLYSRNYPLSDVLKIIKYIKAKNAISILLCYYSGLRAHELATICRLSEEARSSTRTWSPVLFAQTEIFVTYIVTGKGGLRRYVAIPVALAEAMEARRYSSPRQVTDRGIYYRMHYDLGYGKALSQCFTRASLKQLGRSTGLHGLRHAYAKNRLNKLMLNGYNLELAKSIVSQELGHFRPSIVNCYLR